MKRNLFKVVSLCIILSGLLCMSGYAADESVLLPENVKVSKMIITGAQRSSTIAVAFSDITNEGYGNIGVRGETDLYITVPWAKLTLRLQRRETEGATTGWITEETIIEEFENVSIASIDEVLSGYPVGYYYRVKTYHEVKSDENGHEKKTTYTNGVMITNP